MISLKDLNPNVLRAEYAVRGPIVERAQKLEAQGRKIIYCNIGNPQALKQRPLTYLRQLLGRPRTSPTTWWLAPATSWRSTPPAPGRTRRAAASRSSGARWRSSSAGATGSRRMGST